MVDGVAGAVDVVVGAVEVSGGVAGDEAAKLGVVVAVSKRVSRSLRSFSLEHCPRRRKHSYGSPRRQGMTCALCGSRRRRRMPFLRFAIKT